MSKLNFSSKKQVPRLTNKQIRNDEQNLILTNNFPKVKTVIVENKNKKKEKINIDGNEILMEFHCEV